MGAMMAEGEALCFLNDDVALGPSTIDTLYQALMSNPSIGAAGPKGARWLAGKHESFVGETTIEDADAISGFLFMLRTKLFFEIGGFDVSYTPAGFEEIDMSFAIRSRGYRCIVIPGLNVKHYCRHGVSATDADVHYFKKSVTAKDLHERNRSYFMRKWGISK
jgi:GT2 family glycosyltransferase